MNQGIARFPRYRIKRNSVYLDKWEKLLQLGFFEQHKDIIMICAILGFKYNSFEKIEKPHSDAVLMQFFTDDDMDLMDLMAFVYTGGQEILKSEKKYEIFESYSNGGFKYLWKYLELPEGNTPLTENEKRRISTRYYALLKDTFAKKEDGHSVVNKIFI